MKTLMLIIATVGLIGCRSEKNIENFPIYGDSLNLLVNQKMEYSVKDNCESPVWMTTTPDVLGLDINGNSVTVTAKKVGEGQLQVECVGGDSGVIHPMVVKY